MPNPVTRSKGGPPGRAARAGRSESHWSAPPGVDRLELREAPASLELAEPLVLRATPRLPAHLYDEANK